MKRLRAANRFLNRPDVSDAMALVLIVLAVAIGAIYLARDKTTLGVGFLVFGLTKFLDFGTAQSSSRRSDLDETRRLLYTARLAHVNPQWEGRYALYGALVNALAHHSKVYRQVDALVLGDRLVSGHLPDEEILRLILFITDELGDAAPKASKELPPIPGRPTEEDR